MLSEANFVTIHVRELPETLNLISSKELKCMKQVIGIALDVFPIAPSGNGPYFYAHLNPWTERLLKLPNTILTSHIGGSTEESQQVIGDEVAMAITCYLTLGSIVSAINFPKDSFQTALEPGQVRLCHVHHNQRGVLKFINSIMEDYNVEKQFLDDKAKVLKCWSEHLRDLNSQIGADSQKVMILTKSFNFIHSSAKCHQNLVQVQDNDFLKFYGQINYNIEPFGFIIDVMIDKGNGLIDVEEIQNDISSSFRAQLSIWMVLASHFSLPIPWISALLCHSLLIFIEFSSLIPDRIAYQNLDQNSLYQRQKKT
ncbi:hypothetical protein O181_098046 [Austropuccinia psidii MF-1]|uniref:Uncharacterized protein n=1 Tax=Austropuccinia psidii MF-1 TaxID=1389203 RepID=A0A9Q3JAM0_9BASI|nr:hypothetical protein [Austropuccinia psidii MF-1]